MQYRRRTRAYRCSGGNPAFPARWFTAYFVLSPVTGLFCHRRSRDNPATLAPASGRQDHTTLPSAWASFVNAPPKRPPHPASNVRDDREAPLLWERDSESCKFDLGRGQSEIFFALHLADPNQLELVHEIRI